MQLKAIKGTKDILPEEAAAWVILEKKARELFHIYGYREIRTPILEEAKLFTRSIGESSDIVRKEMYSFLDRKERLLCLRPEATASVVRAYLEHDLELGLNLAKLYYIGPMFRAEKPQAGRLRQFHHIGAEAIGCASPFLDVEVILLAARLLEKSGISDFSIQLNSLGCHNDREKYKLNLKKFLKNKLECLCPDCQSRYKLNMLRIFDCKLDACNKVTQELPPISDSVCPECLEHFLKLKQILDSLKVSYQLNPRLVRGLDYYTNTCFEIIHPDLGAQNALGAGGRYDNLIHDLGGPQKPAVGFALGIERLIAVLEHKKALPLDKQEIGLYIATIGEAAKEYACKILDNLRQQNISCETDYAGKSLKGQMRQADKIGAKFVAIIGEDELNKQLVILRDMQTKHQTQIQVSLLAEELKKCYARTPAQN